MNEYPASLQNEIETIFSEEGPLGQALESYEPRQGQIKFVRAVVNALEHGGNLIAECPTGIGKSFGYIIPAIRWIKRSEIDVGPVVIATPVIALQEQLTSKDLPFLQEILDGSFTFCLAKGISNFLCLDKIGEDGMPRNVQLDMQTVQTVRLVADWASQTETGDRSEMAFDSREVWDLFSVGHDECKRKKCSHYDGCLFYKARAMMAEADIIVCNYALLIVHLDLQAKSGGKAGVLPPFSRLILDEGHKLADWTRRTLGDQVTIHAARKAVKPIGHVAGDEKLEEIRGAAEAFFHSLHVHFESPGYDCRLRRKEEIDCGGFCRAMREAGTILKEASDREEAKGRDPKFAEDYEVASNRCLGLARRVEEMVDGIERDNLVTYIEKGKLGRAGLASKIVNPAGFLRKMVWEKMETVILTSATLTAGGRFDFLAGEIGCDDAEELVAESPFDIPRQTLLVLPTDGIPENPNDAGFRAAAANMVSRIVKAARGRTLALFTSWGGLQATREALKGCLYPILVQGEKPPRLLAQEFRENVRSVLLATESFREGLDVPGESLSCVVMDRLPFPHLKDPVMDKLAEINKKSFFRKHSLPRAIIAFRQGFGRLIRTQNDRGIVVCLDRRLVEKPYGSQFLRSFGDNLPITDDLDEIAEFLG